jgi:transcriptional regulator GlxA family with amidase domain
MKRVVSALYPSALATSITLPMDVLRGASQAASTRERGRSQLQFQLAARSTQPVETVGGLTITPQITLEEVSPCDMLLLPAMWRNPLPTLHKEREWLEVVQELAAAGTTICCVGTASCILAETGLLDGKAATTHWNYFNEFSRLYPTVKLKRRHLITQSDNLYCAGSVNSIADLMIHLVEEWFGQRIARAVESQFSPEIRRPFRAHAYQSLEDSSHHDELVLNAQQWIQDQLHEPMTITGIAQDLRCSPRTLSRRFRAATGQSPSEYLKNQRLGAATELLRTTNLSVGEVAWQIGLHDVSYFTSLFQKHTGLTPAKYRHSVRGKLFNPTL